MHYSRNYKCKLALLVVCVSGFTNAGDSQMVSGITEYKLVKRSGEATSTDNYLRNAGNLN
jgi:hypothetical protein